MAHIFISYRREDSAGYAGRLSEALERRLGHGAVFRDVDALQPGQDFVDTITIRLQDARACLVLIGREWLDARGKSGRRRLDEPNDYVLHEIATALRGPEMLVIPVLVEGTGMPGTEELPEPIQSLARRHAASLRDESWDSDVDRLVTVIRKATGSRLSLAEAREWLQRHRLSLAGLAAAALLGVFLARVPNPQAPAESDTPSAAVPPPAAAGPAAAAPETTSPAVLAPVEKPAESAGSRNAVADPPRGGRATPAPGTRIPARAPSPAAANQPRTAAAPEAPINAAPATPRPAADNPAAAGASGRPAGDAERPAPAPAAPVNAAAAPAGAAPAVPLKPTAVSLVKKTLDDYKRAAEALDEAGVRRIWPGAPDGLRNSYRNLLSQSVDLDCAEPDISSDTATVSCREQIRSVGAGRIALPITTNTATFSLRRNGDTWQISRIARQSAR